MKGKFSLSVMPSKSQTAQKHGYSAMHRAVLYGSAAFYFYYFLFLFFE